MDDERPELEFGNAMRPEKRQNRWRPSGPRARLLSTLLAISIGIVVLDLVNELTGFDGSDSIIPIYPVVNVLSVGLAMLIFSVAALRLFRRRKVSIVLTILAVSTLVAGAINVESRSTPEPRMLKTLNAVPVDTAKYKELFTYTDHSFKTPSIERVYAVTGDASEACKDFTKAITSHGKVWQTADNVTAQYRDTGCDLAPHQPWPIIRDSTTIDHFEIWGEINPPSEYPQTFFDRSYMGQTYGTLAAGYPNIVGLRISISPIQCFLMCLQN